MLVVWPMSRKGDKNNAKGCFNYELTFATLKQNPIITGPKCKFDGKIVPNGKRRQPTSTNILN